MARQLHGPEWTTTGCDSLALKAGFTSHKAKDIVVSMSSLSATAETMPTPSAPNHRQELLFDAVLQPNRSLHPKHFRRLMILLIALSIAIGIAAITSGAWPIFGFFGLDIALLYVAFKASYRSGTMRETVQLQPNRLDVVEIQPDGRKRSWSFQPYWLQVSMDDPPEHHSKLMLRSHGQALSIGEFLTPAERLEVAQALQQALTQLRGPRVF